MKIRTEIGLIILLVLSPARTIGEFGYPITLLVKCPQTFPNEVQIIFCVFGELDILAFAVSARFLAGLDSLPYRCTVHGGQDYSDQAVIMRANLAVFAG